MATPEAVLPFRQFVLKIHSRCDLACDHCYVYEHADQSWRGRPTVISSGTAAKAGERIAEHARDHGLREVHVILHGGEPLLAGASRLGAIARDLRRVIAPHARLDLRIHTNGVQLTPQLCELFLAERVQVGISLDGDRAANDLHRRYANGKSSYGRVIQAVELLRQERYQGIYAGLLATVDIRSDPVAVYRALAGLAPPNLDFLLPHGTWDSPPPGAGAPGTTSYADWLIAVFGAWSADGRRVPIRMFESIIKTSYGGVSTTESLGLAPSDVAVIETDGTIEQADSIKVTFDGAPATGLDIFRHPLDAAAAHPGIRARQQGIAGLSADCRQCPVVTSCGGGLYAHRYRAANGFDNPSVYCADLEKIISHVRADEAARPGTPRHSLPQAAFTELAAGYGDADAIFRLDKAQRSTRRTMLRQLRSRVTADTGVMFTAGWDLLVRLDHSAHTAVEETLAHPYVRAWMMQCLRAPHALPPDIDHLASIAAAAAIKSGTLTELNVPVTGGYVHLPTLGRLRVGDAAAVTLAVGGDGAFEVSAAAGKWHIAPHRADPSPDWEPVRELRAGQFRVRLEDTDPYRDCHQWPVASRLTRPEAAAWQKQFEEAWSLIEQTYPRYAPAIAAGLSVLTPLVNTAPGRNISAASRQAYGAVAAALPTGGADLALLIVHEFQHVKLGALLDLFELYDQADKRVFYAPWREDQRPLGALLQGTYAHIGVTDYWRLRRHSPDAATALEADEQFARWRTMTSEAIRTLANSGTLTPLGIRFVQGMSTTVEGWLGEDVPEDAAAAALRWADERRESWRCRGG